MGSFSRFTLVCSLLCLLLCPMIGCGGGSTQSETATTPPGTPQPSITLNPAAPSIRPGDPAVQFTATVANSSNTAVTWSVNGTVGGSAAAGLISATGEYTAPAAVPASNVVSVQASLVSTPAVQGMSAVTLLNPIPVVSSVSPQTIGVGIFTLQINGSGFTSRAQVMFGTTALTTTFVLLNATERVLKEPPLPLRPVMLW